MVICKATTTNSSNRSFDGIVNSMRELAGTVLLTLHTEPRILTALSLATCLAPRTAGRTAPYIMSIAVTEPDPSILSLNADLIAYDEVVSTYLRSHELAFIRSGLAVLVEEYLIKNAAHVDGMNANGCDRMMLNILVLQQNLKNIEPEADLGRAEDYFELFLRGAEAVLEKARSQKEGKKGGEGVREFDYEELKCLVELCWSERCKDPERGVSTLAKRNRGDAVLRLSEVMWQS